MASGRTRDAARTRVVIADRTICHHCKRPGLPASKKFCPECGFPQGGTEAEQYRFIVGKRKQRSEIADNERMVSKARWFLFAISVFSLISVEFEHTVVIWGSTILSLIFVGLGVWSRTKPYPALLTGLIVYVSLQLFMGTLQPAFFFAGLIWKLIITSALFYGMMSAKALERLRARP
jgi:RNA polymerase subunit RPABC4/transcription elongation factor Spt4